MGAPDFVKFGCHLTSHLVSLVVPPTYLVMGLCQVTTNF